MKGRQTIITLKNVDLSYREMWRKSRCQPVQFPSPSKGNPKSGETLDSKRSGRPKATTESEDKFLRVNSLCDMRLTGQQLQAQLNSGRRRLWAASLKGRVAEIKPLLRCQNKKNRLFWATKHCPWTTEDWKKVLWTDKSKFEIFSTSRRIFVCHRVGKRMLPSVWQLLQQSLEELSEVYLISIAERMPQVCSAVISAKDGYFDESDMLVYKLIP